MGSLLQELAAWDSRGSREYLVIFDLLPRPFLIGTQSIRLHTLYAGNNIPVHIHFIYRRCLVPSFKYQNKAKMYTWLCERIVKKLAADPWIVIHITKRITCYTRLLINMFVTYS